MHLWARDEGIERLGRKEVVFWNAAAAIEGRRGRVGAIDALEIRDGRTRRRRNVRGMVALCRGIAVRGEHKFKRSRSRRTVDD